MRITKSQLVNKPENWGRHIVILGAGASVSAFPHGDINGKRLPTMDSLIDMLDLEPVLKRGGVTDTRRNFESIYSELYEVGPELPILREIGRLFDVISHSRDRAIFMLMLRCGLRVKEVADLTIGAMDLKRRKVIVEQGKGGKGRVVYISNDAFDALVHYLRVRPSSRAKNLFLVEKGPYSGRTISVRGIQKRIEYYARKARLKASCHQLRHTMATQLLNADADLVIIQDLLGHSRIKTTQRYCKVSNLKVQRDYFKAMEVIMERSP